MGFRFPGGSRLRADGRAKTGPQFLRPPHHIQGSQGPGVPPGSTPLSGSHCGNPRPCRGLSGCRSTFTEEHVPNTQHGRPGQGAGEDAHEPLGHVEHGVDALPPQVPVRQWGGPAQQRKKDLSVQLNGLLRVGEAMRGSTGTPSGQPCRWEEILTSVGEAQGGGQMRRTRTSPRPGAPEPLHTHQPCAVVAGEVLVTDLHQAPESLLRRARASGGEMGPEKRRRVLPGRRCRPGPPGPSPPRTRGC